MSYYNNLKNTQINGPLNIQDDPTIGGPVAAFNCSRGGTFGGLLTASGGVNTPYINAQGITSLAESTTLPNTISNGSVILICNSLNVTLPSPTAGYCLYFVYDQSLGTGGVATISYPGALNYENPIGVFNNNATNFSMNPNTSFVALASGSEWYIIANSGLLDGIAGLGLLAKLNSTISTTGTGPYTFTVASGNSWVFNGLLTAAGGLTVSGTVTLPAGSIALAALNGMFSTAHTWTALNTFSAGVSISGGFAVTAGTVTFPVGSISSGAFANGSLQYVDITSSLNGLLNTKANLSGGNTFTGNQTFTGTSGVTFSGSSGISVSAGSPISFPAGSVGIAAISGLFGGSNSWTALNTFSNGITITAGGLAVTGSAVLNSGATVGGGVTVNTGGVTISAGGLTVTGNTILNNAADFWGVSSFHSDLSIDANCTWWGTTSLADFKCPVKCENGLTVTGATVCNTGITVGGGVTVNTGGLTVSAGSVALPAGSIANSAMANAAIANGYVDATSSIQTQLNNCVSSTANNTFTGTCTFNQLPVLPWAWGLALSSPTVPNPNAYTMGNHYNVTIIGTTSQPGLVNLTFGNYVPFQGVVFVQAYDNDTTNSTRYRAEVVYFNPAQNAFLTVQMYNNNTGAFAHWSFYFLVF